MTPNSKKVYDQLEQALKDLVKVYRTLLSVVRKEKEILISSHLDDLNENNRAKEAILIHARRLENERMQAAKELAEIEGLNAENPRLLEFANHFQGEVGDRLRHLHSVLDLLLKRVQEHNKQNDILVQSALSHVTGAMESIRDSLSDKPTYKRKGEKNLAAAHSGQLVSREV